MTKRRAAVIEHESSFAAKLDCDLAGLPTATIARLQRAGIRDVGDLLARTEGDLLRLRGIGRQTLRQIRVWAAKRGMRCWWVAGGGDSFTVQSSRLM